MEYMMVNEDLSAIGQLPLAAAKNVGKRGNQTGCSIPPPEHKRKEGGVTYPHFSNLTEKVEEPNKCPMQFKLLRHQFCDRDHGKSAARLCEPFKDSKITAVFSVYF
ncbi:hypothetical protein OUZ56_022971 [Daphnia magna]|uniref:Uncharacterized protein n=1 Tax=Daphnia magna TaxID=35525 RepID=A0ABR0AY05_9CRUS|nr:hypothetical protein OUZ56_022971 [Daphnia magna]